MYCLIRQNETLNKTRVSIYSNILIFYMIANGTKYQFKKENVNNLSIKREKTFFKSFKKDILNNKI